MRRVPIETRVAIEDACGVELTTAEILSPRSIGAIAEVLRKCGFAISL